jgi:chromosome segregation ATPase
MSAEGFALGYLAGSHSAAQTGKAVVSFMTSLRNRRPQIDVNALINEALWMEQRIAQQDGHIAQQDAHIAQQGGRIEQQDAYIKGLKREVAELRALAKEIAGERDALLDWAAKAEAELKRWRSGGEDNSQPDVPW